MFGFLGSLLGGVGSIVSSIFSSNAAKSANEASINEQNFLSSGGNLAALRKNAEAAGYNPLAVLGQNFGSAPAMQVGSPPDLGSMGQNIGRAAQAWADDNSKTKQLQDQLLQAQIDRTNMDTASLARRTFAAPGSPPTLRNSAAGLGLYAAGDAFYPRVYQRFAGDRGEVLVAPSEEFARTQFGAAGVPAGTAAAAGSIGANVASGTDYLWPDVGRALRNWGLDPGSYQP